MSTDANKAALAALQAQDAAETTAITGLSSNVSGLSDRVAATLAELIKLENNPPSTGITPADLAPITADLQAHAAQLLTLANSIAALDPAAAPPPPTLATTTTALTLSPAAPTAGGTLSLVAVVTETPTGAVPTGDVTFSDNGTPLGTGTLDGTGQATFSVASVVAGAHAFTAAYPGDKANAASTSSAVDVTV